MEYDNFDLKFDSVKKILCHDFTKLIIKKNKNFELYRHYIYEGKMFPFTKYTGILRGKKKIKMKCTNYYTLNDFSLDWELFKILITEIDVIKYNSKLMEYFEKFKKEIIFEKGNISKEKFIFRNKGDYLKTNIHFIDDKNKYKIILKKNNNL